MRTQAHIGRSGLSRRGLLASALAGTGACTAAAQEIWQSKTQTSQPMDSPFRLISPPVLTNPAPDGVTVIWAANATATGWVEYGPTEQLGRRADGGDQGLLPYTESVLKVRLEGLEPGTRYYYRVCTEHTTFDWGKGIRRASDEPAASEVYSFTTPNPAAAETRFTVWNDTHEQVETLKSVHAAHDQAQGDFLLWNGDITNDLYAEEKMVDQFLSPAGLPFAAKVPFYFVRGNHDARGPFARRIASVTDVPGGRHYYMFRQGPLAAIVLDTGEDKPDDHPAYSGLCDFAAFRARQAEWLASAIERPEFRDAPYRVLFCHIPLWWRVEAHTGTYCLDGRRKWHDLLVKGRVQAVISGHTHDADFYPADGRHAYVQLIGGGPRPAGATYLRGHADARRLRLTQYRLDGTVRHEVEIQA